MIVFVTLGSSTPWLDGSSKWATPWLEELEKEGRAADRLNCRRKIGALSGEVKLLRVDAKMLPWTFEEALEPS